LHRACNKARDLATARVERKQAAITLFCRSRIPPPRRAPRRDKEKTRRRGSRAVCRTTCSGHQRQGAADRARAGSWRAPRDIDPEAETVAFKSERVVESVSLFALQVRGQHQFVAALAATKFERELHHGFADAVALQRRRHGDILNDRGRRAEVAE